MFSVLLSVAAASSRMAVFEPKQNHHPKCSEITFGIDEGLHLQHVHNISWLPLLGFHSVVASSF